MEGRLRSSLSEDAPHGILFGHEVERGLINTFGSGSDKHAQVVHHITLGESIHS